jgi:hypothetical protein
MPPDAAAPCLDHACDRCRGCQRGRCCRRDNPAYRLPDLGAWDGPIFGRLGFLERDGERVQCHCCGEYWLAVGIHAWQRHDLTAEEYKAIFGLRAGRGMIGPLLHSVQLANSRRVTAQHYDEMVRQLEEHRLSPSRSRRC